ncbi:hypothetical protein AB0C27_50865 [Nonomuraea sp. NPDC048882]|uniref:hypothetical protein n=1 Tax=Nonomuraea sp. NPDC048882 TaxID=3154347 RepID=UPI0033C07FFE
MLLTQANGCEMFARQIRDEHVRAAEFMSDFAARLREGAAILHADPTLVAAGDGRGRCLDALYEVSRQGTSLVRRAMMGGGADLWVQAEHHRAWASRVVEEARAAAADGTTPDGIDSP